MMKILTIILLLFLPPLVFAADKPSLSSLWIELGFLLLMLISLRVAKFPNQGKLIIFITYVLTGIATNTIWFPVILWIGMFIFFSKNNDSDTYL